MLTDTACENAHKGEKAKLGKAFKLAEDKGLFLLVKPSVKGWKSIGGLSIVLGGTEKLLALGKYPEVTLDPSENKKAVKAAREALSENSFEVIAREWGQKQVETWSDTDSRSKPLLERNIFPWLGSNTNPNRLLY
jgi:hypothetical protein